MSQLEKKEGYSSAQTLSRLNQALMDPLSLDGELSETITKEMLSPIQPISLPTGKGKPKSELPCMGATQSLTGNAELKQ